MECDHPGYFLLTWSHSVCQCNSRQPNKWCDVPQLRNETTEAVTLVPRECEQQLTAELGMYLNCGMRQSTR